MSKMTKKDFYLLISLAFILIITGFYFYVLKPLNEERSKIMSEHSTLESQVTAENQITATAYASKLEEELKMVEAEILTFEEQKIITSEENQNLLNHIGSQAKKFNINLIKFEEQPLEKNLKYDIIPFDIKARGESKDLILFMDSLYRTYSFFQIDNFFMRKVEIIPTRKTLKLKEEEKSQLNFNWSESYLNLFNLDIPIQKDEEVTGTGTDISVDGSGEVEEEPLPIKLQLDFTLYFMAKS